jgi:prevent-host-death family protein
MPQVNIHAAKTQLSRLVDQAAKGEPFVIAKSGKPLVTVIPYNPPREKQRRTGFLKDYISAPEDFDRMGKKEIENLFEGGK